MQSAKLTGYSATGLLPTGDAMMTSDEDRRKEEAMKPKDTAEGAMAKHP